MDLEGLYRTVVTGTAGSSHAQLALQFVEAVAALADGAGDVAVGDAMTDANDHGAGM
jgi:hypothetical protein